MTNVINFDDYKSARDTNDGKGWNNAETVCFLCAHRAISTYPAGTPLKDLQCNSCGQVGGIILTGQLFDENGDVL